MTDIKKTDAVAEEKKSDTTTADNIEKKTDEFPIAGDVKVPNNEDLNSSKTDLLPKSLFDGNISGTNKVQPDGIPALNKSALSSFKRKMSMSVRNWNNVSEEAHVHLNSCAVE